MNNIKAVALPKYADKTKYEKINNCIYHFLLDGNYRITLSCELEDGEDTQYPLEDILDDFYVNCTDYFEEIQEGSTRRLFFELEGSLLDPIENLNNITQVSHIIGKRVYNKECGDHIKLIIE